LAILLLLLLLSKNIEIGELLIKILRNIHRVPKKGAAKLMAVTSSNLNRFSKFFYHWKKKEISNKIHVSLPTTPQVCCSTILGNLKVQIWKKMQTKKCHINQPIKVKFGRDREQRIYRSSLQNFTLIGAACRPCGAKNPQTGT